MQSYLYIDMYLITLGLGHNDQWGNLAQMQECTPFEQKHTGDMTSNVNQCRYALAVSRRIQGMIRNENETLSMQRQAVSRNAKGMIDQRLTRPMYIDWLW